MRKEAKLNLIFFGLLLVLITPGFIILMNKKLKGSSRPNHLPEIPPVAAAFNQPPPVRPGLPRVEPAEARQWVTQLLQERAGTSTPLARRGEKGEAPLMGDLFRTQLLALTAGSGEAPARGYFVLWDDRRDVGGNNPSVTAHTSKLSLPLTNQTAERIEIPKTVRHALQHVGYINPPPQVWLVQSDLSFVDASVRSITVEFANNARIETITLP